MVIAVADWLARESAMQDRPRLQRLGASCFESAAMLRGSLSVEKIVRCCMGGGLRQKLGVVFGRHLVWRATVRFCRTSADPNLCKAAAAK